MSQRSEKMNLARIYCPSGKKKTSILLGDARAQFHLGVAYELGEGVAQDLVKAYMWAFLAKEAGDKTADSLLDEIDKKVTADQHKRGQELAKKFKAKNYKRC